MTDEIQEEVPTEENPAETHPLIARALEVASLPIEQQRQLVAEAEQRRQELRASLNGRVT